MYLYSKLEAFKKEIHIALIGCGKFITMFLAQLNNLNNIKVNTIVDLDISKAKDNCIKSGLSKSIINDIHFSNSINDILENKNIDIVIEATGNAKVGILNAKQIILNKKNIIMVNVEADVVAGKYLSDLAFAKNVVYSMAYGDQPALILEQIEWALLNGFEVICAGKGTKYHKTFEDSTPETVWQHYGIKAKDALSSGMNPKMFNSFLTGDKSSIEMAAVANSSHLKVPDTGLNYPCININQIAKQLIPMESGGLLEKNRQLEVITSIDENKKEIDNHLRWGVFLVFKGKNNYVKNCFSDYGMIVDDTGEYTALWRPYHYIGLELAQSIYSIALNKQATGFTKSYKADVAAIAKVNLYPGDILDGEGGYKVKGKLVNSLISHKKNILPLGLSDNIKVIKPILKNSFISFNDIENNLNDEIIKAREYQFQLLEK